MTPELWERAKAIFERVADLPEGERIGLLDARCGGDTLLLSEVKLLLAGDLEASASLDRPLFGMIDAPGPSPAEEDQFNTLPARIGPYTIRSVLGAGHSGIVYLAEEDSPRREVALKVLRSDAGLGGEERRAWARRFAREAQTLALLRHEGIARLYATGTAAMADGSIAPYLALEPVRGPTIIDHARGQELSIQRRLNLFLLLCDAVQHAHQRGVVHADLSPANILVDSGAGTVRGDAEQARPKVLDFGLSRLLEGHTGHTTTSAALGRVVGTLAYMAPEQALGDQTLLDTRTDVYALGAVLYELLSDRPPFEVASLSFVGALKVISDANPERPSGAVSDPNRRRDLRGDLDAITLKCLKKPPASRYQSVGELSADIRRHLDGFPIGARVADTVYLIRGIFRRHRLRAIAAAAGVVVLIGLPGAWVWAGARVRMEREASIDAARSLIQFAGERLSDQAGLSEGRRALLRDLRPHAARFAARLPDDDEVQSDYATVLETLGAFDTAEGRGDRAIKELNAAVAIRRRIAARTTGESRQKAAGVALSIALALRGDAEKERSNYAHAQPWHNEALRLDEQLAARFSDDPLLLNNLGFSCERCAYLAMQTGDLATAREIAERQAAIADTLMSRTNPRQADRWLWCSSRHTLGSVLGGLGDQSACDAIWASTLGPMRLLVEENPTNTQYLDRLDAVYNGQAARRFSAGDFSGSLAIRLDRRDLAIARAKLDPRFIHNWLSISLAENQVAACLIAQGKFREACAAVARGDDAIARAAALNPDHERVASLRESQLLVKSRLIPVLLW